MHSTNFWKSDKWECKYKIIDTTKEECIKRATEELDTYIIPVIEKMASEFVPVKEKLITSLEDATLQEIVNQRKEFWKKQ